MIYDSTRITDVARINRIVCNIRTRFMGSEPIFRSVCDLKHLVYFMSNEDCERFLSYTYSLPYVPWREYDGLTINQMVNIFNAKEAKIRNLIQVLELDRTRVSYTELRILATSTITRPSSCNNHISDILVFNNGTKLDEQGSSYLLVNPRSILYIVLSLSDRNNRCNKVLELLYNSVCTEDDWILTIPISSPSVPLIDVYEAPTAEADTHDDRDADTNGASNTAHSELLMSSIAEFIRSLKPGTEIRIVVPS